MRFSDIVTIDDLNNYCNERFIKNELFECRRCKLQKWCETGAKDDEILLELKKISRIKKLKKLLK